MPILALKNYSIRTECGPFITLTFNEEKLTNAFWYIKFLQYLYAVVTHYSQLSGVPSNQFPRDSSECQTTLASEDNQWALFSLNSGARFITGPSYGLPLLSCAQVRPLFFRYAGPCTQLAQAVLLLLSSPQQAPLGILVLDLSVLCLPVIWNTEAEGIPLFIACLFSCWKNQTLWSFSCSHLFGCSLLHALLFPLSTSVLSLYTERGVLSRQTDCWRSFLQIQRHEPMSGSSSQSPSKAAPIGKQPFMKYIKPLSDQKKKKLLLQYTQKANGQSPPQTLILLDLEDHMKSLHK